MALIKVYERCPIFSATRELHTHRDIEHASYDKAGILSYLIQIHHSHRRTSEHGAAPVLARFLGLDKISCRILGPREWY